MAIASFSTRGYREDTQVEEHQEIESEFHGVGIVLLLAKQ
jgi:hypothetical protein